MSVVVFCATGCVLENTNICAQSVVTTALISSDISVFIFISVSVSISFSVNHFYFYIISVLN